MGLIGDIATVVGSGVAGGLQSGIDDLKAQIEDARKQALMESQARFAQKLKDEERTKQTSAVNETAKSIRAEKMGGLISTDADPEALKEGGLTDWEIQQRQNPKVDHRDRIEAAGMLGYDPNKADVTLMESDYRDKKDRLDERKLSVSERMAQIKEVAEANKLELGERRLDLMARQFNAMASKGHSGSVSDFVQDMNEIDKRFPKLSEEEKAEKYKALKRGAPDSWSVKEGVAGKETTIHGTGKLPSEKDNSLKPRKYNPQTGAFDPQTGKVD